MIQRIEEPQTRKRTASRRRQECEDRQDGQSVEGLGEEEKRRERDLNGA